MDQAVGENAPCSVSHPVAMIRYSAVEQPLELIRRKTKCVVTREEGLMLRASCCGGKLNTNRASDSGASMAEFALLLPLLVMVLFGIIEFGIAFTKAQAIEAAAREGARLASIESSTVSDIETRVNEALTGISMSGPPVVSVDQVCNDRPGESVTVGVSTDHIINIPLVLSNYSVTLNGQAVFRCEAAP